MATRDTVDVLLIGSGASGGPFAWHLSQMSGIKILCLEQGDWVGKPTPQESSDAAAERRRLVMPPPQKGVLRFTNGYPYDHTESDWQPMMYNAVGGASVHWGAFWARMHPSDFLVRSLEGVADDWGITYWDLHAYYEMLERWVGIWGVPGDPAYPKRETEFMPPPRLARSAEILSRGFQKLGWHWWPIERAVITRPFKGRKPCETFCTTCDHGCPREAKNSTDVTFWPYAINNGVVLKTRARVREITINKQGLATGALYYDADGKLLEQKARIVVVACNAIGTPRLLLNSKSNVFPQGLANSSGFVGKCLMGHPGAGATGLFDNEDPAARDVRSSIVQGAGRLMADEPLNGIYSFQHYEPDPKRGFAQGFWWMSAGTSGPIGVARGEPAVPLDTRPPADRRSNVRIAPVRWGAGHHAVFQERFSRQVTASAPCSELPEEVNRIELHATLTDEFGVPAPKMIHRLGENTLTMMDYIIERAKEVLDAAGAAKITERKGGSGAHHLMGTARMGKDPRRSVVDPSCRTHDVKNLFVIDGSVFTTGAACSPTATVMAVALRAADYFKKNARNLLT